MPRSGLPFLALACAALAAGCGRRASPLDVQLAGIIRANALTGMPAQGQAPAANATVGLGRLLFFDKILGGAQNQSCASCHHPATATGDGLRLGRGFGAHGIGAQRAAFTQAPIIPRNAPPVWNAILFEEQFWDGRVSMDAKGVLSTPDGIHAPGSTTLAAQAEFPVTSVAEMRADFLPGASNDAVRTALAARVGGIPAYVDLFAAAFGDRQVTYGRIAAALAAYEGSLMPVQTRWCEYVRGNFDAVDERTKRGALVFYGPARCNGCHGGDLGTDLSFHSIGLPQFGPGKGDGPDGHDDYGRERVTLDPADRYKFRTPTLINVALHFPYGHDGAYATLEGVVRHHLDPVGALQRYDRDGGRLEPEFVATLRDPSPLVPTIDPSLRAPTVLSEQQIADLLAFLEAQTDPTAMASAAATVPRVVPSGLPADP